MKNIFNHKYWIMLAALGSFGLSYAQYPLQNRLFEQNKFGINVAYAGENNDHRIAIVNAYMPSRLTDGSSYYWNQGLLDIYLDKNISTGTRVSYVQQGIFSQFVIEQAVSYKLAVNQDQSLAFGLSFGFNRQSVDGKKGYSPNDYVDLNDPIFRDNDLTQNKMKTEVGVVYKWKKFEFSLAIPALLLENSLKTGYVAYSSYTFDTSPDWKLKPSALMMQTYKGGSEFTGALTTVYKDKTWLSIAYSDSNQMLYGIGFKMKNAALGYNFSTPFDSKYNTFVGNSHQLGLYFFF